MRARARHTHTSNDQRETTTTAGHGRVGGGGARGGRLVWPCCTWCAPAMRGLAVLSICLLDPGQSCLSPRFSCLLSFWLSAQGSPAMTRHRLFATRPQAAAAAAAVRRSHAGLHFAMVLERSFVRQLAAAGRGWAYPHRCVGSSVAHRSLYPLQLFVSSRLIVCLCAPFFKKQNVFWSSFSFLSNCFSHQVAMSCPQTCSSRAAPCKRDVQRFSRAPLAVFSQLQALIIVLPVLSLSLSHVQRETKKVEDCIF